MEILHNLPPEIFDAVIESLVVTIGIVKALRLRVVNRMFSLPIIERHQGGLITCFRKVRLCYLTCSLCSPSSQHLRSGYPVFRMPDAAAPQRKNPTCYFLHQQSY